MTKLALIFFCWSLGFLPQVYAKNCERRFRISINNQPPVYFASSQGAKGLSVELLREVESRLNCPFHLEPVDIPRAYEDFKSYRSDMYAFSGPDLNWEKYGNYIPLYKAARLLIVSKSVYVPGKKILGYLKDPKIKFVDHTGGRFFYLPHETLELEEQGRLVRRPSPALIYDYLINGKAQASFSSPTFQKYYSETKKFGDKIVAIRDPESRFEIGMYTSKKRVSAVEVEKIKKIVRQMQEDGTLRKIVSRYVQPEDLVYYQDL
ncbi:transporter substrate-binding domain-containing protein [Bdellovibrio sp. 22V]|uniref:substrate-binding periplasmic protein n=1 Tax=Bdellovibrio TaxID=958 RepID=UPI002542FF13|nr:transporter substrate-binding domain-containing protein [Bdellovibrio sp. 22V]WII70655.1 transporter substrate-binding domain-containing protein [Bdellovibrio sp. 22V]